MGILPLALCFCAMEPRKSIRLMLFMMQPMSMALSFDDDLGVSVKDADLNKIGRGSHY